jgi:hypothetical protein
VGDLLDPLAPRASFFVMIESRRIIEFYLTTGGWGRTLAPRRFIMIVVWWSGIGLAGSMVSSSDESPSPTYLITSGSLTGCCFYLIM